MENRVLICVTLSRVRQARTRVHGEMAHTLLEYLDEKSVSVQ